MKKILVSICLLGFVFAGSAQQTKPKPTAKPKTNSSTNNQSKKTTKPTDNKVLNQEYTTASGLKYKIIEKGTGKQATPGSTVSVHYTGTFTDGKKFDSSKDRGQPFSFQLGQGRVIRGWDEGIALLQVGDKAIFTVPPSLGYGANDYAIIPGNSTLIFEVELLDVREPVVIKPWDVNGKDTLTTASGLQYIEVERNKDTSAQKAENGKTVEVHYSGFLLNGKVFDSSVSRGQPISFPLGQGMVIKGWEEGIALMRVGDKLKLIIPSDLAYGPQGRGDLIPPNSVLIFDVELVGVR